MANYYSYKRISTDSDKQNFARQTKALEKWAADHNIKYLIEFTEEKSAKTFDQRNQFLVLDQLLQEGDFVIMKDIQRYSRTSPEIAYEKYMEWLNRGINIVFIDNPTICSDYIRQMIDTANKQDIVTKTAMESVIKLLIIVELDRAEQQRIYISQSIRDGIKASSKKSGRPTGKLDKLTPALESDIKTFLTDRSIKQKDLMDKHHISRTTLKKYIMLQSEI